MSIFKIRGLLMPPASPHRHRSPKNRIGSKTVPSSTRRVPT